MLQCKITVLCRAGPELPGLGSKMEPGEKGGCCVRKRFLGGLRLIALAGLLMLGCTGCLFQSVDDLYILPALPEAYTSLEETIQETMDELGAEYATISYGSNTSTVQLLDLDNDRVQETAVVFLRVTAAEEQPLRVCLFRRGNDGEFIRTHEIAGDGTSINSVAYEDLKGDGVEELIISWQMSARVHILTAHMINTTGAVELMNTTYNASYLVDDLDGDAANGRELLVLQQNSTGQVGGNRAEYYRYQEGVMTMVYTAPLSDNIVEGIAGNSGVLSDGTPCVYVTAETDGGVLTDILTLGPDGLRNVTRDEASGISSATFRAYTDVAATDINGDGVLEIPLPVQVPSLEGDVESSAASSPPASTPAYYVIHWRQFDSQGEPATSCVTYHSVTDGWYLLLPDSWPGNITVARDDSLSSRGERAVVFYYWPDADESEPTAFLSIYTLTGNNRETRASRAGRFVLNNDGTTIYAATLNENIWDCEVDQEQLTQRFRLITTSWSG